MTNDTTADFDRQYQTHLKHLKLKGLQPKTIEAYSRGTPYRQRQSQVSRNDKQSTTKKSPK